MAWTPSGVGGRSVSSDVLAQGVQAASAVRAHDVLAHDVLALLLPRLARLIAETLTVGETFDQLDDYSQAGVEQVDSGRSAEEAA